MYRNETEFVENSVTDKRKGETMMLNFIQNKLIRNDDFLLIDLENISLGKHKFRAKVVAVDCRLLMEYGETPILEPYLYLEALEVFQNDNYLKVRIPDGVVITKIGKRLAKPTLNKGDIILFNAYLKERTSYLKEILNNEILDTKASERYLTSFSQVVNLTSFNDLSSNDELEEAC